MNRYPQITICDQWQFVKDNTDGHYPEWWNDRNVHFGGNAADDLGGLLAEHVLNVFR